MSQLTNIRILKPSRKRLKPGDVFALGLPDERYLFGRVVATDAKVGPMTGVVLIYIYNVISDSKNDPPMSQLSVDRLLIPPQLINRLPWSRGYFETVGHRPLDDDSERIAVHCFFNYTNHRYYDEYGRTLPGPVEPVGVWGLNSFRTVDDAVSKALGIPLVE